MFIFYFHGEGFFQNSFLIRILPSRRVVTFNNFAGYSVPISKPFDLLIFGLFGLTRPEDLRLSNHVEDWTITLFKLVFLVYLFVTVIVLINLLIAMMSDTYQRIQVSWGNLHI